ncbi:MAG: geranylgeranylglycerol-phosphate geranylgeranyltransferase [Bacteroidota bacterium]
MRIKDFLNFIRWKNLLMLILVQILIKYVLFPKFYDISALNNFYFSFLVLSTVFIAAAGYIINDIYDLKTDMVNKPNLVFIENKISKSSAVKLYLTTSFIGILLGIILSIHIEKPYYSLIFILISILLFTYSTTLKSKLLLGNLLVSLLIFSSILIVPVFDLFPISDITEQDNFSTVFLLVKHIAVFAFMLTMLREIVKDIEDIKGDYKINAETLPIVLGIERTKNILAFSSLIPLLSILYFGFSYYTENKFVLYYLVIFVVTPLLYFVKKILSAKSKSDFHKLSNLLKYIMLFGILTIFLL